MAFREIEKLMPMKEPADKIRIFRTLLKGQALSYFEHHLMRRLEAEDSEVPDNKLIELVLRDVGSEYIPKRAIRVQKYYMRQSWGLYMGLNTSVKQFLERQRLNGLNCYLLYFLVEYPKQLDQDEIIEILDQDKVMATAKAPKWHEAMINANIDIFEMTYEESVYCKGTNMWCHYCDKNNHNTADCRAIAKLKQQKNNKAFIEAKPGSRKKSLVFKA
jgi:hypothetical protein